VYIYILTPESLMYLMKIEQQNSQSDG